MKILMVNAVHTAIGSRIPQEQLPPLGLLAVGGPLIDDGHEVRLLDADRVAMPDSEILRRAIEFQPEVLFFGHSGSTTAHPVISALTRVLRQKLRDIVIVYGGVYPTFRWKEVLRDEPQIDLIVRGEGEQTALNLIEALRSGAPLSEVPGIAYREGMIPVATPSAPLIHDLDAYRVGWELIDHQDYRYWGDQRAVVVQFSRGCPHACSYCGQQEFWRRWRHRDPRRFAAEIARLYRQEGVKVFNLADENPNASKPVWRAFLEAMIAEDVPVILVGSARADNIVRDADILHLYKKAGIARLLMGIENYNEKTLTKVNKGGSIAKDREAIRLLRRHGILSMATYVVGFEEERDWDYLQSLRELLAYDPDQIQLLYAAPHPWTQFCADESHRKVMQADLRKWDYKHQVLTTKHVPAWRVLLWVKLIEAVMQGRPKSLWRLWMHPDRSIRAAIRWYYRIGRRVWPYEILNWLFRDKHLTDGPTLKAYQADPGRDWEADERWFAPPRNGRELGGG